MPLQKQAIKIPLTGLNEGIDPKDAPIGTLDTVENAYRVKSGEYLKRNGSFQILNAVDTGSVNDIRGAFWIGTQHDQIVTVSPTNVFQYSTALSKFINKGTAGVYRHSSYAVAPSLYRQAAVDVAYYGGYLYWCWEEWELQSVNGGVAGANIVGLYYAVTDATTGQVILGRTAIVTTGNNVPRYAPKVVQVGTSIMFLYQRPTASIGEGGGGVATWDIMAKRIAAPTTAPGTLSGESTVQNIGTTGNPVPVLLPWDVMSFGGQVILVYKDTSNVFVKPWNENMTSGGSAVDQGFTGNSYAIAWLNWDGSDSKLYFANGIKVCACNSTTFASTSGTSNSTTLNNVAGYVTSATSQTLFYDAPGANRYNTTTTVDTWTSGASASTSVLRSVGLVSRPFKTWTGTSATAGFFWNIMLAYDSVDSDSYDSEQSVYLQYDATAARVVGKPLPSGLAAGYSPRNSHLSSGVVVSTTETIVPMRQVVARARLDSTQGQAVPNVYALVIDAPDSNLGQPINSADVMLMPGSQPRMFDGQVMCELGFHYGPEKIAVADGTGFTMDNGSYRYKATYEWTDGTGRLHRSAPSPASEQITISSSNHYVQVTVSTLRMTDKSSARIAIWREDDDSGIYHRVADVANDATADTILINDHLELADAEAGDTLYALAGVLENIAPAACTTMATGKGRVWFGGSLTGEDWFSKPVEPGFGVETSDFLIIPGPDGKVVKALVEYEDKMALIYSDQVWSAFGDGPNNLNQGDFGLQKIGNSVGSIYPRAVASTPAGGIFKCQNGWRIIRGAGIEPFGLEVKDYDSTAVTGAAVIPIQNQVLFTLNSQYTLVYDFAFNQWYTTVNATSVLPFLGVCRYGDIWAKLHRTALVAPFGASVTYETPGYYTYGSAGAGTGTAFNTKYRTDWLNFAGLGGFERIYAIQVIGEFVGAHTLKVTWEFDFNTSTTYVYTVVPSTNPYRFEARPPVQRCTTARITIEEVSTGNSAGFKISGLNALVGIKPGQKPVAAASRLT